MKEFKNREEIYSLVERIQFGELLTEEFKCNDQDIVTLLDRLGYSVVDFEKNGFILKGMNFISRTDEDSIFVSTRGFVSNLCNDDKFYLAYKSQAITMELILEEVGRLFQQSDVHFMGSYNYEKLSNLSIALIHNQTFYLEIYAKAYLSLSNVKFKHIHDLEELLKLVENSAKELGQVNSIFHRNFNENVSQMTSVIQNLPGNNSLNRIQSSLKYGESYDDYIIKFNEDSFNDLYESIQHDQMLLDYYSRDRKNEFFKGERY